LKLEPKGAEHQNICRKKFIEDHKGAAHRNILLCLTINSKTNKILEITNDIK